MVWLGAHQDPLLVGWHVLGYSLANGFDIYDSMVISLLLLIILNALFNACFFPTVKRRQVPKRRDEEAPKVSVLIPARNEAHQIEVCLESLSAQTYTNLEIIVLDDCSEDGTADVVKDCGFTDSTFGSRRLIRGEPLPRGWAGKPWACYQLSRQASGKYLLFTDADTVHHPESVESAIAMALKHRTHLLSVWPHQITVTWAEKLVIPVIYMMAFAFIPFWFLRLAQAAPVQFRWMANRFWERSAVANGQFMLFKREAYEHLGTHEKVKHHLVEDVALSREVLKRLSRGWRLVNADGHHIVECRMHRDFFDVWEGFSKNLRPLFEKRWTDFVGMGALLAITGVLPFFFFLAREHPWLVILQVELILILRLLLTVRFRTSWLSILLHPFAVLLTLSLGLNSWWIAKTGRIAWKRREYAWRGTPIVEGESPLDDLDR